jgi:hypothetical protein
MANRENLGSQNKTRTVSKAVVHMEELCAGGASREIMAVASSSSSRNYEIESLKQQLSLKDAVLETARELREAKDAVIASKDAVIAELRASKAAVEKSDDNAQLISLQSKQEQHAKHTDALLAQQAQEIAATKDRLQQLEAANSSSSTIRNSSSSSSSNHTDLLIPLQKRAPCSVPLVQALDKDEILDEIFSFVGVKEWLYVGAVCRRWRGRYLSMCYRARASKEEHAFETSQKSSFVTAARFSMALDNGLTMPDASNAGDFFGSLSMLSEEPIAVLTLARVHGAAWHKHYCSRAAYSGDFELLKWLHKLGCPWTPLFVAINAIRSTERQYRLILPWLFSIVDEWSQADTNTLLAEAGINDDLVAAGLLLARGAEWPDTIVGQRPLQGRIVQSCWRYTAIAWAISKGYCWEGWRCQDLAPELYTAEDEREDAVDLFKWAHDNGCPCTCEPEQLMMQ